MMTSKLTFKKAFGTEFVPLDMFWWNVELEKSAYELTLDNQQIRISFGSFGVTDPEKIAISLFRHSNERDLEFIHKIPTVDISFTDVYIEVPDSMYEKWKNNSIANQLVEPFIHIAFKAINQFIDSCRDVKYLSMRGSDEWLKQQTFLVPQMTQREFKTYLFYVLESRGRTFVGCFSEGEVKVIAPFDIETQGKLQKTVEVEVPLDRKLMVRAWEYFFQEDFRSAVIYSTTVIELVLIKILRKTFISQPVASESQIDRFLEQTSNRLLCTVILGLLRIGDGALRDDVADVFEVRNGLIHGKRKNVTREETKKALVRTEEIVRLLEQFNG
jgi:hypothetical protein